jgi:hypothetical protein
MIAAGGRVDDTPARPVPSVEGAPGFPAVSRHVTAKPRQPWTVLLFLSVLAVGATARSAATHSLLLYGDARAHLDVARHVTDGLRTGLAQLGSVWLPLPHLLLAPLVAARPLWQSGAAGAMVGGVSFIYGGARLYSTVEELAGSRLGAWVGLAIFAANANMLYLQSTALTEPVLLACLLGAVYHVTRWMRTLALWDLTWAGVLIFLATLTRYEGWALLAASLVAIQLWTRYADRRRRAPQANLFLVGAIGTYGIVLWILYNLVIFGNPLYFIDSTYSARVINGGQAQFGLLGTKGDLVQSALTYAWDVIGTIGPVMLGVGLLAAIGGLVGRDRGRERRRTAVVFGLLLTPVAFEVISLYAGQITIRVPQLAPHQMWNDRYGIMALPFVAVAAGTLVGRWRTQLTAVAAVGALGLATAMMALGTPLTVADGRTGVSSATAGQPEVIAQYLHDHYRGGEILADDGAASPAMFASGLDLRQFVSPGFHPYWDRALISPEANVSWVLAYPGDAVSKDMDDHPGRFAQFALAVQQGPAHLYSGPGIR